MTDFIRCRFIKSTLKLQNDDIRTFLYPEMQLYRNLLTGHAEPTFSALLSLRKGANQRGRRVPLSLLRFQRGRDDHRSRSAFPEPELKDIFLKPYKREKKKTERRQEESKDVPVTVVAHTLSEEELLPVRHLAGQGQKSCIRSLHNSCPKD